MLFLGDHGRNPSSSGKHSMSTDTNEVAHQREMRFVLHPHRSLSPNGFLALMLVLGGVSFVTGMAFLMMGAWPVFGFFGLDVALVYFAFRLNFRSGRLLETIDVAPNRVQFTRIHPTGRQELFTFNPAWVRVRLVTDRPDGRTSLRLASHGREVFFGKFLTDEERVDLAGALKDALVAANSAQF
jgi:uncharacterized membrane protein